MNKQAQKWRKWKASRKRNRPNLPSLRRRYIAPPFSVIEASGWRRRSEEWRSAGIYGECGREPNLLRFSASVRKGGVGTSTFPPTLCEITYSWFCPKGGTVLDTFAGGSTRGIVASKLGLSYVGVDLSERQVRENRWQAGRVCGEPHPRWIVGDARAAIPPDIEADFIFTSPPFFDRERYSNDPADLSNLDWTRFGGSFADIIRLSSQRLRPDRFAAYVVGDVRDASGNFRDLPGLTIRAFEAAGLPLYNRIVIANPLGSAAFRARRIFDAGRKVVPVHLDLLVFVKGDGRRAAEACKCGPLTSCVT